MPQEIHDRRAVQALMDAGAQVVEVLPREEFEEDHLPGAIHVPFPRSRPRPAGGSIRAGRSLSTAGTRPET
jgi:rhodanese-related sulfurtransferase